MEIIKLTSDDYGPWDNFCLNSDDAWFWHTSTWTEYASKYQPELKSKSLSFFIKENNEIIAIAPLLLEDYNGAYEFTSGGTYNFTPAFLNSLSLKHREKVLKFIFTHIDKLAREHNVRRAGFRFPVLNKSFLEIYEQRSNYLPKFNFLDTSISTQIIDLRETLLKLRREVRHGHDSDIDRGAKILTSEVFNKKNITREIFNIYSNLHRKAAGRVTRPQSTFDDMFDIIQKGSGFLVGAKKRGIFIGFTYFLSYKNNVYYGSGCFDPDFGNLPIAHFVLWRAIEWMHQNKFRFFEIGNTRFPTLNDQYSPKEQAIGHFTRGFCGFSVQLFRAEKYYSKEYFLEVYNRRLNDYLTRMNF